MSVTGVLTNRLKLPLSAVPPSVLRALTYRFSRIENVEIVDDDGEIRYEEQRTRYVVENFRIRGDKVHLHAGRLAWLRASIPKDVRWRDNRSEVPMGIRLKMTYDWRYNMEKCFAEYREAGGGLVNAPTSWGKTYFGIRSAIELDQRVLVLASKKNWCDNWLRDFYKHTNGAKLESQLGRKVAGVLRLDAVQSETDLFPCLNIATPQSFMSARGKRLLKRLRRSFGMIIFDEAVELPALQTSKVFSSFHARWRMGLSADEQRKDEQHKLTYDYCGPVVTTGVFSGDVKTVRVEPVNTGTQINANYLFGPHWFGSLCTQLSKRVDRNTLIVSRVLDDVLEGYKVLVLVDRRDHAVKLGAMLAAEIIPVLSGKSKNQRSRPVRVEVLRGGDKDMMRKIEEAGARKYDVLIAMDRAVGKNTDMPGLDCCHDPSPTTNQQVLNQRTGRVLRDYYKCDDCGITSSNSAETCPECKSHNFRKAKKWPVKLVPYRDEAYPDNSRPARFLDNAWRMRMAYYKSRGFEMDPQVITDPRERGRTSFIKRKV